MKVSELAKDLNTTTQVVLDKLKSMKLKAKGPNQELSKVVGSVVRSALIKDLKDSWNKKAAIKSVSVPKRKGPMSRVSDKVAVLAAKKEAEKVAKEAKKREKEEAKKAKEKKKIEKEKPAEQVERPVEKKEEKKPEKIQEKVGKKEIVVKKEEEKIPEPEIKVGKKVEKKKEKVVQESKKAKVEIREKGKPKKVKPKISDAPFVSVKPLLKKKKKPLPTAEREGVKGRGKHARKDKQAQDIPEEIILEEKEEIPFEDLKALELKIPISVKDFAVSIDQKTGVILKKLMGMRIFANINQNLDEEVARELAREFGYNLTKVKTDEQQLIQDHEQDEDDPKLLESRAPVVTFMGHVDHGKTSLLDRIRKSRIADQEHGGITQHIGAYSVKVPKGKITFLDTPGHEAFTAMRARGAHITDLVVVVIAADEGVMPQTMEAIDHSHAAGVPILVALNKIDRKNADIDRVKKQLADHGLNPEDWGGKTIVVPVSAVTGEGIEGLLEMILLEAEMLELKANARKKAAGIIVEAHLSRGKGAVASLIVQSGTLRNNDLIIVGPHLGKIKAMFDYRERPIEEAGPSTPVEVLGLPGVPEAGEKFYAVTDEKRAKEIVRIRQNQLRDQKHSAHKRLTLEDFYSHVQEGSIKELDVILKADVQGSLEALKDSLEKIPSEEVKVKFIHTGVGEVNASDVILAVASNAIIIAFQVGIGPRAAAELEKEPVDVRQYRIIYDAVNDVKNALEGLLAPKIKRKFLAKVEVRQVFKLSKSGMIAGCFVLKGKVPRKAKIDVVRNGDIIFTGNIQSLKRFKDDVREVNEGYECGISIDGFDKMQEEDILEVYELESIARTI